MRVSQGRSLRFKMMALGLSLFAFVLGQPLATVQAVQTPDVISVTVDQPIVSSDGTHYQTARVVVDFPGRSFSTMKTLNVSITNDTVLDHAFGVFGWSQSTGFHEFETPRAGSEYANLLPPDSVNPNAGSQVIVDGRRATFIYRWTLNRINGTTHDLDVTATLKLKNNVAAQMLGVQSAYADESIELNDGFDTNTPPSVATIPDEVVIVEEPVVIDVASATSDFDGDPITIIPLELPTNSDFSGGSLAWAPGEADVGVENVQFAVNDPYGTTTLEFDIVIEPVPVNETGMWTSAVSTVDAPEGRTGAMPVWTDEDMLVWGGTVPDVGVVGTGANYDVATNTWTAIAPAPDGYATTGHQAVWTGSQMLVWGGQLADGTVTNEGRLYDPVTDSWTSMSTVDAPAGRYDAVSVWTGEEFLVWGGARVDNGVTTYLDDGAAYNPVTDTWTPVSASGLAGRSIPQAVWTGSEMMIWGGNSWESGVGTTFYNDGALYNRSTDSWTPVSAVDAPVGRILSSMVFGNNQVIVWGGFNFAENPHHLQNGGIYDLATSTWTPMSVDGAPVATTSASAAWTGVSMVVWGGSAVTGPVSTGGVFDPTTNTWLATPSADVPAARSGAGTLWMGTSMLIWGGVGNSGVHWNDGAIYTP